MPDRRAKRGPGQPTIEVITKGGSYQHLTPYVLDILLANNKVMKFKRSSGWAIVGVDPIRVKERRQVSRPFTGLDRRSPL
jgi:hypothetical protein